MVLYENECVGCEPWMGCLGDACPHRHVPHFYCDDCGDEAEELYIFEGQQICEECLLGKFEKIGD